MVIEIGLPAGMVNVLGENANSVIEMFRVVAADADALQAVRTKVVQNPMKKRNKCFIIYRPLLCILFFRIAEKTLQGNTSTFDQLFIKIDL
jgi:hypothetical protein